MSPRPEWPEAGKLVPHDALDRVFGNASARPAEHWGIHRLNRSPRPQPQKFGKLVFLIEFS